MVLVEFRCWENVKNRHRNFGKYSSSKNIIAMAHYE